MSESRNRVTEDARGGAGALTFNAETPRDYDGRHFTLATVRLGDHAHVDFYTGRQNALKDGQIVPTQHRGHAGRLVFAWHDWLMLRDLLASDDLPEFHIREVEQPTPGQLKMHAG